MQETSMTPEQTIDAIRENFPQELIDLDQWVLWRLVRRKGDSKPTKQPHSVTGTLASSTDPHTWAPFEAAARLFVRGGYDGLGFVFSDTDPYLGVDLDGHYADGQLDAWALEAVQRLDSYTELSPSGTGVHVIVRAAMPGGRGRKEKSLGLEMYDRGRFFTVTGRPLDDRGWLTIPERQAAVDWLYAQLPKKEEASTPGPLDDDALLQRMFASKNGAAIRRLWDGDISAYGGDESAADIALCNHLAFWTAKDPARMDRLFRRSGLFRDKWNRNARSGETYGQGTIREAIEKTRETYSSNSVSRETPKDDAAAGDDDGLKISERIDRDLRKWGYDLWLNDMDESVWNGDERLTDSERAVMRMTARDAGYARLKLLSALDDAVLALAARRRRHPVREYLHSLTWDGADHIGRLASFFDDKHAPIVYQDGTQRTVFHTFLLRWLIGSVAKMHGDENAARSNFVLVLAGDQDVGKSHFASWLCPLPSYFVEKHITPDDKDCSLQRTRSWIWEIMELGATTNRANVEALKAHITATKVTERKPYGHFDTVRPAVSAYIGTVNPDGAGFLSDSTGNRRFAVVDIEHINWRYADRIDIHQVWAQTMHLWRQDPKGYRFDPAELTVQRSNAESHMAPDIMADMLVRTYTIDPTKTEWRVTSSEILDALRTYAGLSRGQDKVQGRELARTLKKEWGIIGKRTNGATVYVGLVRKVNPQAT